MLTKADEGGVSQMLTIADGGGGPGTPDFGCEQPLNNHRRVKLGILEDNLEER